MREAVPNCRPSVLAMSLVDGVGFWSFIIIHHTHVFNIAYVGLCNLYVTFCVHLLCVLIVVIFNVLIPSTKLLYVSFFCIRLSVEY